MHEQKTLEMIAYKLSKLEDQSKVREILICELEVHDPERFKRRLREFLKRYFPQVDAKIRITSPIESKGIRFIMNKN